MNKPKILAIAPYEGLKELMEAVAKKRNDFIFDIYTGDLSDGAAVVQQVQNRGFDLIISRGGTAHMIEAVSQIPVIEIEISGYDMLRAFRLAQNYQGYFAIIGFPNITDCAHLLSNILQYPVDIFTIHSMDEAEQCLEQLYKKNYTMVVGDVVTTQLAEQKGLNSILITSGAESIESAFDRAVSLYETIHKQNFFDQIFKELVNLCPAYIACYDHAQELIYQNDSLSCEIPRQQLGSYLQKQIPSLKSCRKAVFTKRFSDRLCQIYGFYQDTLPSGIYAFFVREIPATPHCSEDWLKILHPFEDKPRTFHAFYTNSAAMKPVADEAMHFSKSNFPIIIAGENGTGKASIALAIHGESSLGANPFVDIDCSLVSSKAWENFLNDPDSPFYFSSYSFFFKHSEALSEEMQEKLIFYLEHTASYKRNRLLFSWRSGSGRDYQSSPLIRFLTDKLGSLTLYVPSLNERKGDIPSLASIRINALNLQLGKQIIGLEEEALSLLQSFSWTGNFHQFWQVMNQLILLTDTSYISAETTKAVLAKQSVSVSSKAGSINLNQDLDHIISDVIKTVFLEEDQNQSRTAQRLGISRSTLWRRLKEGDI